MGVVGRRDAGEIDAVAGRQPPFGVDHFLVGAVGALGRDRELRRRGPRLRRIRGQRAGDQHGALIHAGRHHVNPADEAAVTADQPHV